MNKTLYIIGNGFDLHHGIPCAYKNFGEYLSENANEIYQNVVNYLHADDDAFWSNFEQNLAHLDSDLLLETASDYLVGYIADDWSDANHHDYQYEIDQVVSSLSSKLLAYFKDWVRQLPIPASSECLKKLLCLDKEALFITFNYTSTLTSLYSISEKNILYIHGKGTDENLVLGHGWEEPETQIATDMDQDDFDTRVQEGDEIIRRYFTKTFKPTEKVIAVHQNDFNALADLEQIFVFGHSLGDVDIPYFFEIVKHIDTSKVRWTISYHIGEGPLQNQFKKLEIPEKLVNFIKLEDYCSFNKGRSPK